MTLEKITACVGYNGSLHYTEEAAYESFAKQEAIETRERRNIGILDLARAGMSTEYIRRVCGLSRGRVIQLLKQYYKKTGDESIYPGFMLRFTEPQMAARRKPRDDTLYTTWRARPSLTYAQVAAIVGMSTSWVRENTIYGWVDGFELVGVRPLTISTASLIKFLDRHSCEQPTEPAVGRGE